MHAHVCQWRQHRVHKLQNLMLHINVVEWIVFWVFPVYVNTRFPVSLSTVAPFGSGELLPRYAIKSSFSGSPLAVPGIRSCCSPAPNDMFFVMEKHFALYLYTSKHVCGVAAGHVRGNAISRHIVVGLSDFSCTPHAAIGISNPVILY